LRQKQVGISVNIKIYEGNLRTLITFQIMECCRFYK